MPDAAHVLAWLRRDQLIRSWTVTDKGIDIVIGRGTTQLPTQDTTAIASLATRLRRDRIRIVGTGSPWGPGTTRYELTDGRALHHQRSRIGRAVDEFPYEVMLPGGHPSGCAIQLFSARTKAESLALAGIDRVRGRCVHCGTDRPLLARTWTPEPGIRCPGCNTASDTPVQLHCRSCSTPITIVHDTTRRVAFSRIAWEHINGSPFCNNAPPSAPGFDRQRARP